jgi:hypothetical protein
VSISHQGGSQILARPSSTPIPSGSVGGANSYKRRFIKFGNAASTQCVTASHNSGSATNLWCFSAVTLVPVHPRRSSTASQLHLRLTSYYAASFSVTFESAVLKSSLRGDLISRGFTDVNDMVTPACQDTGAKSLRVWEASPELRPSSRTPSLSPVLR